MQREIFMLTREDRKSMLEVISDLSKDAYGYRVRLNYSAMSDEELQTTWDSFISAAEESTQQEDAAYARAQTEWENHIQRRVDCRRRTKIWTNHDGIKR